MGHWTKLEGQDLDYLYEEAGMKPKKSAVPAKKQTKPAKKPAAAKPAKQSPYKGKPQPGDKPKRGPRIRGH
jgi:23S rRNA pseudouridine2605 synthase